MEKLYDVIDLMKDRLNELEEVLDEFEEEKNINSILNYRRDILDMVNYWLKLDFIELKVLIDELVK